MDRAAHTGTSSRSLLWAGIAGVGLLGVGILFLRRRRQSPDSQPPTYSLADKVALANTPTPSGEPLDDGPSAQHHVPITDEDRQKEALRHKNLGNKYFQGRRFEKAIECYTKAINVSPDSDAENTSVFFCNRAACYSSLDNFHEAVKDCDEALKLNKTYVKALNRRAFAHEKVESFELALVDYTSACMLSAFQNEVATQSADRLLKDIGKLKSDQRMKEQRGLPSKNFITTFLSSFPSTEQLDLQEHDVASLTKALAIPEVAEKGDLHALRATAKMLKHAYEDARDDWKIAVEMGTKHMAVAQEQLGTFLHLQGDMEGSLDCYNTALEIKPSAVSVLIKRATLWFEKNEPEKTFADFDAAIQLNSNAGDIWCHRGQVYMLQGEFETAVTDLEHSLKLNNSVPYTHIHLGFSHFKQSQALNQNTTKALEIFNEAEETFPDHPDVYNFHGELLAEMQMFEQAIAKFEKAIQVGGNRCPLAYVNHGVLLFQIHQDAQQATSLCHKAIGVDPLCEAAYLHLAQLALQQGQLKEAVERYDQAINLLRTQPELSDAFCCREAAVAQLKVQENPDLKEALAKVMAQR